MTAVADPPTARPFATGFQLARRAGAAPALQAMTDALGGPPPIGHQRIGVVLGRQVLPSARALLVVEAPGGPVTFVRWTADAAHLVPDDRPARNATNAADVAVEAGTDLRARWTTGLAWIRLGLSIGLRDACLDYLSGRRTGSALLVHDPMIKCQLTDAFVAQLEYEELLGHDDAPLPAAVRTEVHRGLTELDRDLLRLLGASGFAADGPGGTAQASELLAEICATWQTPDLGDQP
ncbi:MAG TPA: hypothetical protein VI248_16820 [Kineosporiaceae bacterium]